jgi:hypothetical protein
VRTMDIGLVCILGFLWLLQLMAHF